MSLSPVLISAATDLPVSVEDAVSHVNAQGVGDDALIELFIGAAAAQVGLILGRALVTQTWRQDFDGFDDELRLPLGPLSSVTHVKYYDGDGALQTLSSSVYVSRADESGSYLMLAPNQSWPSAADRDDAVQVTFVVGTAAASVPPAIKAAILLMVGDLYAFRETVQEGTMTSVPMSTTVDKLIAPYRGIWI
jgi:uncharacterized phiE125 gp8 family phage protein